MNDGRLAGGLYILAAVALLALIGPLARWAYSLGISPMELVFWRVLIAWGLFALHATWVREVRVAPRHLPGLLVFGLVCVFGLYLCFNLAVVQGGAALASILLYTAPAWVVLMAPWLLRERLNGHKLLAVALTLLGVASVALDPQRGPGLPPFNYQGILFGLASGVAYAVYYLFGKRFLSDYKTPTLFLYALPLGLIILWPLLEWRMLDPWAWLVILLIGVVCTYGAYSLYYAGLQRLEATRASVLATVEPLFTALIAWVWWDEAFGTLGYLGGALILAAVLLTLVAQPARRSWNQA